MNNYSRLSGATALSARTARACESCLKRRARWFCPADDAFLCHPCDSSVHSANELAGRHTRVRLSSSSSSSSTSTSSSNLNNPITHPTWHRGFTRKARTPRRWNKKNQNDYCEPVVPTATTTLLVPQMESEVVHQEESGVCFDDGRYYSIINGIEEKDHLELGGFSVPVLDEDPFEREVEGGSIEHEFDFSLVHFMGSEDHKDPSWDILPGFDLASLEEDVGATVELEKLVVKDECEVVDYWDMEIFGSGSNSIVKQEEKKKKGDVLVMEKDEYGSGGGGGEGGGWLSDDNNNNDKKRRKLMMLQLNYDEVIQEWNKQGCPAWSAGHVDHLTIDAWSSSSYATTWQGGGGLSKDMGHEGHHHQQQGNSCRHQDDADGGRGARVMRYREKRKNRLFAKKIRYQVRKLNAEKRPRLKGRFVKRTVSTSGSVIPTPTMTMTFPRRHSSFPSPPTGATGLGLGIGVGPSHH